MKYRQTAYAIYAPSGRCMTSTVSASRQGAKRKCLDPIQQKYHGLVNTNFSKWEKRGYVCKRVLIKPI